MSIKDVFIDSLENRIRQLKKSVRELIALIEQGEDLTEAIENLKEELKWQQLSKRPVRSCRVSPGMTAASTPMTEPPAAGGKS